MKYAIIGSGKIGTALAPIFARKNIKVGIANSCGPETLTPLARQLGPGVAPQSLKDALEAEIIFLAVPFPAHKAVARALPQWDGRIVIDTMNTLDLSPKEREELGGLLSSEVVSQTFAGARVVKGFNHLPAEQLGTNQTVPGKPQAIFLSSNDADASTTVAALVGLLDLGSCPTRKTGPGWRAASRCGRPTRWTSVSEPRRVWLTKPTKWKRQLPRFHFVACQGGLVDHYREERLNQAADFGENPEILLSLLGPQRNHRVHSRCASGRNDTAHQSNAKKEESDCNKSAGVIRFNPKQHPCQHASCERRCHYTQSKPNQNRKHPPGQSVAEDVPFRRAQRQTDTDFLRLSCYRKSQRPADANNRNK
jgi:8-hydroxy-5-deazaflavin:NADPH oxidoreductase